MVGNQYSRLRWKSIRRKQCPKYVSKYGNAAKKRNHSKYKDYVMTVEIRERERHTHTHTHTHARTHTQKEREREREREKDRENASRKDRKEGRSDIVRHDGF